ncbi:Trans-aconitate 3-methyltransferase [Komagataella phaffii CBS 7435]|uniref:Trans-aconitate methyltransferase n=2 Tax=Komagataella phaffii TaxID=460519 RepID=C4R482_KOMPG|nr:Trans-aconitate methyltransferase [Komagataella phaffii GS115]AOA64344.1 GQ67_03389T0 [Komagataella phaffii]CAH2449883.1 Trans-aconitate 3-methyltransferase [Komagataella phaffii CBS 7435]AOA68422.1 GQ68_03358T0 [Komagataella phaffii GS115]CAY70368.1 Trans-aconitate methyltransferase [Komagataella phaffii GS115]CCA39839.1 Trans-aconitate 3-methyltransferase [Komagataella phaffii CBS 7435]
MATFTSTEFNSENYDRFRPVYPDELYQQLVDYHVGAKGLCVDVGCGSGQATFTLKKYFDKVIGSDISENQLAVARKRQPAGIEFRLGTGEDFSWLTETPDVITAAECLHWVDPQKFVANVANSLRDHGTLSYWLYTEPIFQNERANQVYNKFTYGSDYLGPYWDPGRTHFRNHLKELNHILLDSELFDEVKISNFKQEEGVKNGDILYLEKEMTISDFINFVSSWPSVFSWKQQRGKEGILDDFYNELNDCFEGGNMKVIWNSVLVFARRKQRVV